MENVKLPKRNFVFHPSQKETYPLPANMTQDSFDNNLSYKPSADDVFVCTYPKSGTTWITCALFLMRNKGEPIEDGHRIEEKVPFLERSGISASEVVIERPRIIKTHLMFKMVPMSSDAKYIYVARNPKDCVVSFYFHTLAFDTSEFTDGKFDDFFDMFMAGKAEFGDYFESVGEWFEESKTRKNICFLLYEDLKENFEKEFLRISEFLGKNWKEKLLENNKLLLRKVLEHSSFGSMRKYNKRYTSAARQLEPNFFRKGEVCDWKNLLSEEQSHLVDEKLKETANKYQGFDKLWDEYGCL